MPRKEYLATITPKHRAAINKADREARANLTPAKRRIMLAKAKERSRRRQANLTAEQRQRDRDIAREREARQRRLAAEKRRKRAELQAATLPTPEQLERKRVRARERERRKYLRKHPLSRKEQHRLFTEVRAKVPATLPPDIRDDVVGRVFEAIITGRLTRAVEASDVKRIIAEHYRQFSKFDTVSLDAIVHEGASRGQLMGIY